MRTYDSRQLQTRTKKLRTKSFILLRTYDSYRQDKKAEDKKALNNDDDIRQLQKRTQKAEDKKALYNDEDIPTTVTDKDTKSRGQKSDL